MVWGAIAHPGFFRPCISLLQGSDPMLFPTLFLREPPLRCSHRKDGGLAAVSVTLERDKKDEARRTSADAAF